MDYKTIALNKTAGKEWDILVVNGQIILTHGPDYIVQKVRQVLQTYKGEYFYNQAAGLPYFQEILMNKVADMELVKSIIRSAIVKNKVLVSLGVTGVEFSRTEYTPSTRALKIELYVFANDERVEEPITL